MRNIRGTSLRGGTALFFLCLAGCTSPSSEPTPALPAAGSEASTRSGSSAEGDVRIVTETFETPRRIEDNVDSVAFYQGSGHEWLIATAKSTHVLNVYDASTGELLRQVGGEGDGEGKLRRPNGIAVVGDLAVVVERDNRRVQLFHLPSFEPAGHFGADVLRRPYGLALVPDAEEGVDLFVTDNYETPEETIPPPSELGERVKHFHFKLTDNKLEVEHVRSFGETSGPGTLDKVETIAIDPGREKLLLAEELETEMGILVYSTNGTFTGQIIGAELFLAEPEGIGLYTCGDAGYWVMTDQFSERTHFRVFDRTSFQYLGAFSGEITANTDGAWLTQIPTKTFPEGAFFAVHDDQSVTAFDWRQVASALHLDC